MEVETVRKSNVKKYPVLTGEPHPIGTTVTGSGVNFSLFSKNATGVDLCLYQSVDSEEPYQIIALKNHTFYYWHVLVQDLPIGALYGYKVYGPFDPLMGNRFDASKLLIDPMSFPAWIMVCISPPINMITDSLIEGSHQIIADYKPSHKEITHLKKYRGSGIRQWQFPEL